MTKNKIFFLIIFVILLFPAGVVLAADMSIQQYVKNWFNWGLVIAGLLAAVSFAVGAAQYIYSDHANGKERMLGAVLGLVLIFSSWLILQTINPKIATLELGGLTPMGAGVYYGKNTNDTPSAPTNEPDTTIPSQKGYRYIKYMCFAKTYKDASGNEVEIKYPYVLVWTYYKPNFQSSRADGLADSFKRINCDGTVPVFSGGSFKWTFETLGVYFYTGTNCDSSSTASGVIPTDPNAASISSEVFTTSQSPIPGAFYGNIRSLRIVNGFKGRTTGIGTGVILHENPKLKEGGACDQKIYFDVMYGPGACEKVQGDISVHATDIFYLAKDPKTSGTGVNFYSTAVGWQEDKNAGYFEVPSKNLSAQSFLDSNEMVFDWGTGGAVAELCWRCSETENEEDCGYCPCKTFGDCPGSIQVNGDYIVSIGSKITTQQNSDAGTSTNRYWCQTFTKNVDNLGAESFFPVGYTNNSASGNSVNNNQDKIDFGVMIIPTTH